MPNLLLEATPERVVTCILPGVKGKAPARYEHEDYVQQLIEGWDVTDHVWHTRRVLTITALGAAKPRALDCSLVTRPRRSAAKDSASSSGWTD